ncbi:hypothetical protein DFH06DRAFT_698478 [Mycena polygramma]|nr:hypothetical protein DFH06DRAFT_698478 [Mycena polygramma]
MSVQTARRARMASPNLVVFEGHSPKPILKRPSPLNLKSVSHSAMFASTITIVVSPSPPVSSPHVHFPASPILTAVFSTHSPNSYDRSATKVTPNPLELPGWGTRVYSPGEGTFSSVRSPSAPVPVLFVDPPSFAPPAEDAIKAVRFGSRPRELELGKAISVYPRSPYPSAPMSPMTRDKEKENVGVARAKSLDSPKSQAKRFINRPPSLNVPAGRPATPRISLSTPLSGSNCLTPVQESPRTVTLASTRLSQEFWQSVSLEEQDEYEEHRPCAMEAHEEGSTPISAVPRFIFGTKDGVLWSPGLPPKESSSVPEVRSPTDPDGAAYEFEKSISEEWRLTSPRELPRTYPTIATVLSADATTISYPPPVLNRE